MAAVRCTTVYVVLTTLVLSAALVLGSKVEPPGGECEAQFTQGLFNCFTDLSVPFNTFLWVVGNGTGGIEPDNATQFRQNMCGAEGQVVQCVLDKLHALVDAPYCQQVEHMQNLLTDQLRTIFEEYDASCAHECRHTLEDDMRQCYKDNDVSPDLFMPASGEGSVLGETPSVVRTFCSNRESVIACLKKKKDACPEAPYVMKRLGLDLSTFSEGLRLLCREQKVYLSSLGCFQTQTRAVEKCQEDNRLSLMRLLAKTKTENVSQESFLNEFCSARVQYIRCDLTSWAAKKHRSCNSPALALKRDLHCSQIPTKCSQALAGPIQKMCTYDWASPEGSVGSSGGSTRYRASMQWQGLVLSIAMAWVLVGCFCYW